MKKILFVISAAILIAIYSAPSLVKAQVCGYVFANFEPYGIYEANIDSSYEHIYSVYLNQWGVVYANNGQYSYPVYMWGMSSSGVPTQWNITVNDYTSLYLDGYQSTTTLTDGSSSIVVTGDLDTFYENIPEEFRPVEPSAAEQRWTDFYDWFYEKFGYYPREGSLIDLIRLLAIGDWTDREEVEITYPTLPPPTPTPTPIPVQTIFVPDGNGNTTIIYQYTDPTTGVITQSPYNPNIDIDVNCNCDGDDSNNIFNNSPTDPYTLTSSMLWADGFGVEITDNPLTAANDSQKSLAEAAAEYSDSVNVVSNSFNVLPFKWLMLVGLLGGILIIAGLIRTFLGG